MKRLAAKALLASLGLCVLFLFADMLMICLLDETLIDAFLWDADFFPSRFALITRIEAILAFSAAGLIVFFRSPLNRVVTASLDRLGQRFTEGNEAASEKDARPVALLTAMLLLLGVIPILIYLVYEGSYRFRDFFVWPLVHASWLVVSTIIMVGLVKRRHWAYYALTVLCAANLLMSGYLAIRLLKLVIEGRFHGPHGFGALAALGAFIGLVLLVAYLGVSVFLTVYLWVRRKHLRPISLGHVDQMGGNGYHSDGSDAATPDEGDASETE